MANKEQVDGAWDRAKSVRGRNPDAWRRDEEGNLIRHGSYGNEGQYGWEVGHRNPVSKGGTDNPRNLRALQWEANREKADKTD